MIIPKSQPPLPPQVPQQRTWWGRNWKWALPVFCLVPVLFCGGLVTLILTIVFGSIRSSDACTGAVARARADAQVRAVLGEPIEPGYFVSGRMSVSGPFGNAQLAIPLTGPKGSATLYAVASKFDGVWSYSRLEVEPANGADRIHLLAAKTSPTTKP